MKTQKKRQYKKRVTAFLLMMIMTLCTVLPAYAGTETDVPDQQIPAKEGDTQGEEIYAKERSGYFASGYAKITYNGNNMVTAFAETNAMGYIYKVTSLAIIEQYSNGQWGIVDLKQKDSYNNNYSIAEISRYVTPGHAYRCHGIFITLHNAEQTRKEVWTDSLWLAQ